MILRIAPLLLILPAVAHGVSQPVPAAQAPAACAAAEREQCRRLRGERPLPTWRQTATEDDRRRLRQWRDSFVAALREARESGHEAEIAAEGALLQPDAAIRGADLPPGDYHCRTIKLGSQGPGGLDYTPYPPFRCRVSAGRDGLMNFTKLTGSQRPVGRLYAESPHRQIFLGTMQLSDERQVLSYGRDRDRNMAGQVERIGERRWRILFPYPHFESTLDVIELVPAS